MGFHSLQRKLKTSVNFTKARILIGCFLTLFPFGIIFGFGNIYPYMFSYVRLGLSSGPSNDLDPSWWFPGHAIARGVGTFSFDVIQRKLGIKWGLLTSICFQTSSLLLTYFTLQHSVWATFLTFSCFNGFCTGLTFAFGVSIASANFKRTVGKAVGVIMSSTGVAAVIFDFLVAAYVNPENHVTDVESHGLTFFSNKSVVNRAPTGWLIIGTVTGSCLGLAFFLIIFARNDTDDDSSNADDRGVAGTSRKADDKGSGDNDRCDINKEEIREDDKINKQGRRPPAYCSYSSKSQEEFDASYKSIEGDNREGSYQSNNGDSKRVETWRKIRHRTSEPSTNVNDNLPSVITGIAHENTVRTDESEMPKANKDMSVMDALKSISFYCLYLFSVAINLYQLMVANYYKMLGQLWIADDFFLTMTGNFAGIVLIPYRIAMGLFVDTYGLKNTLTLLTAIMTVQMACWYFTAMASPWLFMFWTDFLMVNASNFGLLMPLASFKLFGQSNYVSIYACLQTAAILCSLVFAPLFSPLITAVGWFWAHVMLSVLSLISLLMTVFFLKNNENADG